MTVDLNTIAQNLHTLLEQEKAASHSNLAELRERKERRQQIYALRDELNDVVGEATNGISNLPQLPRTEFIEWANAALEMPLVFLVLDTVGLDHDADIIRVVIHHCGSALCPRWDSVIKPERRPGHANTTYTGLTKDDLEAAPTLREVWESIRETLKGKYVLSFGLDFVKARLAENASHYGLEPITLIGRCFQDRVTNYLGTGGYSMKLTSACHRIGHPISEHPTAPERAAAQLALLKAMSQGITNVPAPATVAASDSGSYTHDPDDLGLDDHPF